MGREEAGSFGGYAQTTDKQRGKTGLSPGFIEFEGGPIAAPLCGIALTLSLKIGERRVRNGSLALRDGS